MLPGTFVAADDALDARLFSAITAAAARSSEARTLVMMVMVLTRRRRVVVGRGAGPRSGTVHAADTEVGAGLLQLVRSRQTVNCAQRRCLHGPVHGRRVLHVEAAGSSGMTGEVVMVTPRRQAGQRVRRSEHRQRHRNNSIARAVPSKVGCSDRRRSYVGRRKIGEEEITVSWRQYIEDLIKFYCQRRRCFDATGVAFRPTSPAPLLLEHKAGA